MSKKWDFLKEVTDIDDRFIEEAAGEWIQPIRNVQQILVKIAACFAIIVSLLLSGVSFNPTARVMAENIRINSAISLVADLYLTLHSNEITFSFTIYAEKISTSVA